MKLLLIFILFLLFFILGSGMNQELKENITVTESSPEKQDILIRDFSISENYNWLDSYFRMLDVLASVKQLNLFQDQTGHSHHQEGKVLPGHRDSLMTARIQALYVSKFMRLLSARHVNGFYIYSLEKLII